MKLSGILSLLTCKKKNKIKIIMVEFWVLHEELRLTRDYGLMDVVVQCTLCHSFREGYG